MIRPGMLSVQEAAELNAALVELRALRQSMIAGATSIRAGANAQTLLPGAESFWARLTAKGGSPTAYSWEEIVEDTRGVWAKKSPPNVGSLNAFPVPLPDGSAPYIDLGPDKPPVRMWRSRALPESWEFESDGEVGFSGPSGGSSPIPCRGTETYVSDIVCVGGAQRGFLKHMVTRDRNRCVVGSWTEYLGCCGCDCSCGSQPEGSQGSQGSTPEECECNGTTTANMVCPPCHPGDLCVTTESVYASEHFPCDGILDNQSIITSYDDFAVECAGVNIGRPNEGYIAGWNIEFNGYREVNGSIVHYQLIGTIICPNFEFNGKLFVTNGQDCNRHTNTSGTYTVEYNSFSTSCGWPSQAPPSVGDIFSQEIDVLVLSCDPLAVVVFMNDIRLVITSAPCTAVTKYFCVTPITGISGPPDPDRDRRCQAFDYPPGPLPSEYVIHGGPYDTSAECIAACTGGNYQWWCVGEKCVQSATEPDGATGGPYESEGECALACSSGPLWYCVTGFAGNGCVLTDDPSGYTVIAGPFATQAECEANCLGTEVS